LARIGYSSVAMMSARARKLTLAIDDEAFGRNDQLFPMQIEARALIFDDESRACPLCRAL
jgi:hypothetical protein